MNLKPLTKSEKAELYELENEFEMSSLGDRPTSMAAKKLRRLLELEHRDITNSIKRLTYTTKCDTLVE